MSDAPASTNTPATTNRAEMRPADLLADLESRQDEVLRLLADLEARTARALAEVVAAAKVLNAEEPAAAPSAQPLNPSKLRAA